MANSENKRDKAINMQEKREEFRKYLEVSGTTDKLTSILMKLYQEPERPADPVAYISQMLCDGFQNNELLKELQAKIDQMKEEKKMMQLEFEIQKSNIKKTPEEIQSILKEKFEAMKADESCNSLLKEYMNDDIFAQLKDKITEYKGTLLDNIQSGLIHFDSEIGIFASDQNAYDTFAALFTPVLEDLHDIEGDVVHPESDWGDSAQLEDLDPEGNFIKNIKITLSRAFNGYEFMPIIKLEKLDVLEEVIRKALMKIEDDEIKGSYHSYLDISDEQKEEWISNGTLFTNTDKFLTAAESYRFWPKSRGLFLNEKNNFRVWINEEEPITMISLEEGANLQSTYNRIVKGVNELKDLDFAKHERWGYVTHNLKNIGNTLRITVKAKLPQLSLEENASKFETLMEGNSIKAKALENGYFELTSMKKVGRTEFETAEAFQKAIKEIVTAEKCAYQ